VEAAEHAIAAAFLERAIERDHGLAKVAHAAGHSRARGSELAARQRPLAPGGGGPEVRGGGAGRRA